MKTWIRKVFRQECTGLFRGRPSAVALLFGIPLLYCILFGFAYSSHVVKYIPTVIYDQDQTATSRTLIRAYVDSERYDIVGEVTTQEEMEQYLRDGKALVAVAIPPDFAKKLKNGLNAEVLIMTNAVNLMFANTVISSSQEITQTVAAAIGQKLFESAGQPPAQALYTTLPIKFATRILYNPTTSYSNFMLAGLGANGLQLAIILVTCTAIVREFAAIDRWKDCPTVALFIGKLLPYWACAMLAFLTYIAAIVWLFAVPYRGSLAELMLIGAAFTFAVCSVGFFFSAIAKNEILAIEGPILYIMPAFLFCGYSWPQFAMEGFVRAFSALLPLSYAAEVVRDILLVGYAPELYENVAILLAFGFLLLLVSVLTFERRRRTLNVGGTGITP